MWGLLIILAGSPMPAAVTWHMTHEACQQQAAAEMLHVECRSYVMLPRGG